MIAELLVVYVVVIILLNGLQIIHHSGEISVMMEKQLILPTGLEFLSLMPRIAMVFQFNSVGLCNSGIAKMIRILSRGPLFIFGVP